MNSAVKLDNMRALEILLSMDRKKIKRLAETAPRFYKQFDTRKNNKSKWRHIDNPTGELKSVQKIIANKIFSQFPFPETMFGGIKDRSIAQNASIHIGKALVITLDLKSCFPKTNNKQVFKAFREYFNATPHISSLLTKLTTVRSLLPQGAPTSSSLANLCLLKMHNEIAQVAKSKQLEFSMFVDDIAVSGESARDVIKPIIEIIQKHGHAIGNKKKKIMPNYTQQLVTGIVVNQKLSIPPIKINATANAISKLINREYITLRQLLSVKTRIGLIKKFNPSKGILLERLARKLPDVCSRGNKSFRGERRTCRNRNCLAINKT